MNGYITVDILRCHTTAIHDNAFWIETFDMWPLWVWRHSNSHLEATLNAMYDDPIWTGFNACWCKDQIGFRFSIFLVDKVVLALKWVRRQHSGGWLELDFWKHFIIYLFLLANSRITRKCGMPVAGISQVAPQSKWSLNIRKFEIWVKPTMVGFLGF